MNNTEFESEISGCADIVRKKAGMKKIGKRSYK
jgi:hypothetical protein